jgi:putative transposase
MYNYRKMSPETRRSVVEARRVRRQPWHAPPHWALEGSDVYLVSATCYEHTPVIGKSLERMTECEGGLLSVWQDAGSHIYAWCVLPNHYHAVLNSQDIKQLCRELGKFHGRSSFKWNGEDNARGRQVWYRCFDRAIRTDGHFWASVNYVHNNAVHHGYVEKWLDWPWSSAADFLERVGRQEAMRIWREYPILDYGKKWDV